MWLEVREGTFWTFRAFRPFPENTKIRGWFKAYFWGSTRRGPSRGVEKNDLKRVNLWKSVEEKYLRVEM